MGQICDNPYEVVARGEGVMEMSGFQGNRRLQRWERPTNGLGDDDAVVVADGLSGERARAQEHVP